MFFLSDDDVATGAEVGGEDGLSPHGLSGGRPCLRDVPDSDSATAPRPRFQRLCDRLAGRPADTTLRRDVPAPLETFLRKWIDTACQLDGSVGERVALRLEIDAVTVHGHNGREYRSFAAAVKAAPTEDLFDVVDAILHAHAALDELDAWDQPSTTAHSYVDHVVRLDDALTDSGSAFTVDSSVRQLVDRVDPTVAAAVEQTIAAATPTAATLLRDAWNRTYGLHPDPTTAYRDAVRAVEEVACPLVLATAAANNSASLGTVRNHLRDAPGKWQFTLVDKDGDGSVTPLVAMLDRLWTGQVSRHGGGQNSRDQTREEAQAAVHLAATLVQLLGAGALTRRGTP